MHKSNIKRLCAWFYPIRLLLYGFILVAMVGCAKSTPILIAGTQWMHSHEEDQNEIKTYRPSTYNFRPSRGRTGYTFLNNGQMTFHDIGPSDKPVNLKGTWRIQGKTDDKKPILVLTKTDTNRKIKLKLVSYSKDAIQLAQIE